MVYLVNIYFVLINYQKEKFYSNKVIKNFLENANNSSINNEQFSEIASSLSYYLRSFSNINKFLDYISLLFKHMFGKQLVLIIPLTDKGELWSENIRISGNIKYFKIKEDLDNFLKFSFSKNSKLKDVINFEVTLKNNFKNYKVETHKLVSRGKSRGFIYVFFFC